MNTLSPSYIPTSEAAQRWHVDQRLIVTRIKSGKIRGFRSDDYNLHYVVETPTADELAELRFKRRRVIAPTRLTRPEPEPAEVEIMTEPATTNGHDLDDSYDIVDMAEAAHGIAELEIAQSLQLINGQLGVMVGLLQSLLNEWRSPFVPVQPKSDEPRRSFWSR